VPPFRRTETIKRPRRWFAPSLPASGATLSPSAAIASWVVPTAALIIGALTLSPTAPTATWTARPPVVSGALTLAPTAATTSWTVPAASISAGALTLAPSAGAATWSVPSATLSNNVTLTPTAPVATWTTPTPVVSVAALTLATAAPHVSWVVPAASLFSGVIIVPAPATRAWHANDADAFVAEASPTTPIIGARGLVERRGDGIRTRNRPPIVRLEPSPQEQVAAPTAPDQWQPTDNSGAGLAFTYDADDCFFVRAGDLVHAYFRLVFPATASGVAVMISGLPVSARATLHSVAPVPISFTNAGLTFVGLVRTGATFFQLFDNNGVPITNAQMSGKELRGCAIYEAAS
jgi:hypothetical protein